MGMIGFLITINLFLCYSEENVQFTKKDEIWVQQLSKVFNKKIYQPDLKDLDYERRPYAFNNELLEARYECITLTNVMENESNMKTIQTSEGLDEHVKGTSSAKASLQANVAINAMGVSAKANVAQSTNKETSFQGTKNSNEVQKSTIVDGTHKYRYYTIKDNCLQFIAPDYNFLKVFEQLPVGAIRPEEKVQYQEFMESWGTHVITGIYVGMKFEAITTMNSVKDTTAMTTKASACQSTSMSASLSIAGSGASYQGFSLSTSVSAASSNCGASSGSKSKYDGTSETSQHSSAYGGTVIQRGSVLVDSGAGAMSSFLTESNPEVMVPVEYVYRSLWDLFQRIYPPGSNNFQRAKNLAHFYEDNILPVTDADCVLKSTRPYGKPWISSLSAKTKDLCQKFCLKTSSCSYWGFNTKKAECKVYKNWAQMKPVRPHQDWVIVLRYCGTDTLPKCARPKLKAEGVLMTNLHAVTKDSFECQTLCANSISCKYFNFNKKDRECTFLKKIEKYVKDVNYITGPRHCLFMMINDDAESTMEHQIFTLTQTESIFDLSQPIVGYQLTYPNSQCLDKFTFIEKSANLQKCSSKCKEIEECYYFAYNSGTKECINAGHICKMRNAARSINFNIYRIVGSGIDVASILKNNNECQGHEKIPYCSCSHTSCQGSDPVCFAETLNDCAARCQEKYSSSIFLWSVYDQHPYLRELRKRCICYEPEKTNCESFSSSCIAPEIQQNSATCYHNVYSVLDQFDPSALDSCPMQNQMITSSKPAIGREFAKSMAACCDICKKNKNCDCVSYEVETKYCYLLVFPITSIATESGWLSCTKNSCASIEDDIELEWWNKGFYL